MNIPITSLKTVLEHTGYQVAYRQFRGQVKPPYIVYYITSSNNFKADNKVYQAINNVEIELYTDDVHLFEACKKIEDTFDIYNIIWDKVESYIEKESIYQIAYSITI